VQTEKKATFSEMEAQQIQARSLLSKPIHEKGEEMANQCQPRLFYSQAQKQPCCLHPSSAPTHLPYPNLSASSEPKSKKCHTK